MRSTLPLLSVLALAPIVPSAAQKPASQGARVAAALSPDVLRGHLEYLADDALEGRAPGTRGGELAQKYIASQFRRLGLEPAGDSGSYFQRVPDHLPDARLRRSRVTAPAATPLAWKDDYVLWSMRNDSSVSVRGEAVFVGYGIVAPEVGWNDYAGLDVKGKIVVALVNDPGLQDSTTLPGQDPHLLRPLDLQDRGGPPAGRRRAPAGAHDRERHLSVDHGPLRLDRAAGAAGESARLAGGGRMAPAGDRGAAVQAAAVRTWRRSRPPRRARGFKPVPLGVTLEGSVRSAIRRTETANVLGRLPGRGALAKEAVLIGGHYDHFGIGAAVDGDSIYNGAEDNASGTAAVLAAAEAFVRSGVRHRALAHLRRFRRRGIGADRLAGARQRPADPAPRHRGDPQSRRHEPLRTDDRTSPPWASTSPRWGRPSWRPPRRRGWR